MLSREQSSTTCFALAAALGVGAAPRLGHADDDDADATASPSSVSRRVEPGALLPSGLAPSNDGLHGLVMVTAGWNQVREGATYDTSAEARVAGPVSLQAGAVYDGPGTNAASHIELRLDALRQEAHGVDIAVAAGYTDSGFNLMPAAVMKMAIGRSVGANYLLANVVYEQALREDDRAGELRLAALRAIAPAVSFGLDSRFEIDLERDNREPAGEAEWEWRGGAVANYAWNRMVFVAGGGVSALRLRSGGATQVGPVITAGIGTVF